MDSAQGKESHQQVGAESLLGCDDVSTITLSLENVQFQRSPHLVLQGLSPEPRQKFPVTQSADRFSWEF